LPVRLGEGARYDGVQMEVIEEEERMGDGGKVEWEM
jgi:hypothetical protein